MTTYITHSVSLSMMPPESDDPVGDSFDWRFQCVSAEEFFTEIKQASAQHTVHSYIVLPMMDAILAYEGLAYDVSIPSPERRARPNIRLQPGDVLLAVRYHGRKLQPTDRSLPKDARLVYYRMTVGQTVKRKQPSVTLANIIG